jgi:hypothetical protein
MSAVRTTIAAGLLAAAAVAAPAASVTARPIEGGGTPVEVPACTPLRQLVIVAPPSKAKAIIGLTARDSDVELARIRAAVAASCTVE